MNRYLFCVFSLFFVLFSVLDPLIPNFRFRYNSKISAPQYVKAEQPKILFNTFGNSKSDVLYNSGSDAERESAEEEREEAEEIVNADRRNSYSTIKVSRQLHFFLFFEEVIKPHLFRIWRPPIV
tara:strand:- start:236 stop:607 length:372 start_codon:yes stop_codon:yes gene_type:complete